MTEVQDRRKKKVEASMTEQVHLIMQQHLNGGGRLLLFQLKPADQ